MSRGEGRPEPLPPREDHAVVRGGWRITLLTAAAALVVYLGVVAVGYDGRPYLRGDSRYYYVTALSLIFDHDVDLENQLRGGLEIHGDEVALDRRGRLVPKHPLVLPLLAAPVLRLAGPPGALVFNLLQLTLLVGLLHRLTLRVAAPRPAAVATLATAVFSLLPHYAWNFSPDVLTTLLYVAGLVALAAHRPLGAGLCLATACVGKLALLVTLPPAILAAGPLGRPRRALAALALGGLAVFTAYGLSNQHLFGSPLTTSYDRIARLENGEPTVFSVRDAFEAPLGRGLAEQLADREHGLLFTSPLTLASLLLLPILARRHRPWAWLVALTSLALLLFYAPYELWRESHYGNRFLMPLVALGAVPLAAALERIADRRRHRPVAQGSRADSC